MTEADWPAVEGTYADGIAAGNATFKDAAPSWESTRRRQADYYWGSWASW